MENDNRIELIRVQNEYTSKQWTEIVRMLWYIFGKIVLLYCVFKIVLLDRFISLHYNQTVVPIGNKMSLH